MSLEELRQEIDEADRALLDAVEKRMAISRRIGEYKKLRGQAVYDSSREDIKIRMLESEAGVESRPYIKELYETIFKVSREHQQKRLFGVLGRKLPHTYSPLIHRLLTSEYTYTVIEREPEELDELFACDAYGGFNVTIPYKKEAAKRCDVLDAGAGSTGAVNTVVFGSDGKVYGYNTDIFGFEFMMKRSGIEVEGKNCLILGHGGASEAVKYALEEMGSRKITFCGRSEDVNYTNVYSVCDDAEVIVNCTPVGMYPEVGQSVLDLSRFPNCRAFADLIYNPSKTKMLYEAYKLGMKTAGGLSMLAAQAYKAAKLFEGDTLHANEIDEDAIKKIESVITVLEKQMKNITLIGMPGCGKSTLARAIAGATGRELTDLDVVYEERYGEKPSATIETLGEDRFRDNESELAMEHLFRGGVVISCGGGIVTRDKNHYPLKANSVVIYLKRPLDALASDARPLTSKKGVEKLYEERHELYENLADIVVSIDRKDNKAEMTKEAMDILKEKGVI